jgi:hypothetical protein
MDDCLSPESTKSLDEKRFLPSRAYQKNAAAPERISCSLGNMGLFPTGQGEPEFPRTLDRFLARPIQALTDETTIGEKDGDAKTQSIPCDCRVGTKRHGTAGSEGCEERSFDRNRFVDQRLVESAEKLESPIAFTRDDCQSSLPRCWNELVRIQILGHEISLRESSQTGSSEHQGIDNPFTQFA